MINCKELLDLPGGGCFAFFDDYLREGKLINSELIFCHYFTTRKRAEKYIETRESMYAIQMYLFSREELVRFGLSYLFKVCFHGEEEDQRIINEIIQVLGME